MGFKSNFKRLCYKKGVSPYKAMESMGMPKATYVYWREDTSPQTSTIIKICEYLGCTREELLEDTSMQKVDSTRTQGETIDIFEDLKNNPNKRLLFSAMQNATDQEIKETIAILEALKKVRQ